MILFQSRSIKTIFARILIIVTAFLSLRFIKHKLQIVEKRETSNTTELTLFDLISQYKIGKVDVIDLKTTTSFQWDRLYVFGPYTHSSRIVETVGTDWADICSASIEYDDGIVLLVFTLNGRSVQCVEYGRDNGDFDMLEDYRAGISIDDAHFVLDKRENVIMAK